MRIDSGGKCWKLGVSWGKCREMGPICGKNAEKGWFCRKILEIGQTCGENAKTGLFDRKNKCWKWVESAGKLGKRVGCARKLLEIGSDVPEMGWSVVASAVTFPTRSLRCSGFVASPLPGG